MRYRDVYGVTIDDFFDLYNSSSTTKTLVGVSSVDVSIDSTTFTAVGDYNRAIRYVGLTKMSPTITIESLDVLWAFHAGYHDGKVYWLVPPACYPPLGSEPHNLKIEVENCVCTERRVSLTHGELAKETLTIRAYSSDGTTSPISISVVTDELPNNGESPWQLSYIHRDLSGLKFTDKETSTTTTLNEVQSIEWTESGTVVEDSSENDVWLTCIFVTDLQTELTVTFRDLEQVDLSAFKIGRKGKIEFDTKRLSDYHGLSTNNAYKFTADNATITGINFTNTHADYTEVSVTFLIHGTMTETPFVEVPEE